MLRKLERAFDSMVVVDANPSLLVRWSIRFWILFFVWFALSGMHSISHYAKWQLYDYIVVGLVQGNLVYVWLSQTFAKPRTFLNRIGVSIVLAFICFGGGNIATFFMSLLHSTADVELDIGRFTIFIVMLAVISIGLGTLFSLAYSIGSLVRLGKKNDESLI